MELWIRSQNKDRLVKVNNIEIQHHYTYKEVVENYMPPSKDKYIKSVIMCDDEIFLGEYKTKERALEVLDEIQNKLLKSKYDKASEDYGKHSDYKDTLIEISSSNYVYEMPQK